MTVELTIFSVIAVVFIIYTVLVHLLNWMFRKSNQGMYSESDMTGYALYILHNDVITPQEWVKRFKK